MVMTFHEIRGDRHYGIHTTGKDELKSLERKGIDISHATLYMPSSYNVLEKLMKEIIKYPSNKSFLDIGCGKGRVMVVAAEYGFTRIIGIDFSKEFCEYAKQVTRTYRARHPQVHFSVKLADASYYTIDPDTTTIFLFNPFDEVITAHVVDNIIRSQQDHPRTIRILYVNPVHVNLFLERSFVDIFHFRRLHFFEGCILERTLPEKEQG
jgi:SAM-dependent methyltransferase